MMSGKPLVVLVFGLLAAAGIYLFQIDYARKLDTDVSSLLPQVETEDARIARRLISEEQGRAIYLEVEGLAAELGREEVLLNHLKESPWVESVVRIDQRTNLSALKLVNDRRMELLFPKWLSENYRQYLESGDDNTLFADWGANKAVADMDFFLESPSAIELSRNELMDPLLLSIGALLRMSDGGEEGARLMGAGDEIARNLYWVKLAESPLSPETQKGFAKEVEAILSLFADQDLELNIHYGGLLKLASASRERIQSDVFKINLLSVIGVVLACGFLAKRPWRMLWALPTLVAGVVGGLTISFLVFESVNVIVLVVGSVLIGTSIDYAIHLIFKEYSATSFPTGKLIAYACFSTVVGFTILIFAELALIRQIGVFVGAGLLCAYVMAKASIRSVIAEEPVPAHPKNAGKFRVTWTILSVAVVLIGGLGLTRVKWKDDLRNLEAPNEALIKEDQALRSKFGSNGNSNVFLTTGRTYLEAFESESALFSNLKEVRASTGTFGFSEFAPLRSDIDLLIRVKPELSLFFERLKYKYEEAGYELEMFEDFFSRASDFLNSDGSKFEEVEATVELLADSLAGPMEGALGRSGDSVWSLSSASSPTAPALESVKRMKHVTLFSQLSFLNQALDKHREALFRFGIFAALFVSIAILIVFGMKKGVFIVLYPIFSGVVAVGLCALLFEELNMFHLVGCFLGGAIALDYALFAVESYGRGLQMPSSVWLSGGTTTASFLALGFSAIPVVKGLGLMVALLACLTLLLLHSSQVFLRKVLRTDGSD